MRVYGSNRFKRLAVLAALAVILGQFSLTFHDVVAEHDIDAACETCVGADRLSAGGIAFVALIAFWLFTLYSIKPVFAVFVERPDQAARPRGPPTI